MTVRIAANISLLFRELPALARPAAAARAGFDGVEILFPYDHPVSDWRSALGGAAMPLALINTPAGNWAAGERGFAAVPGAEGRFRADFHKALAYARALGSCTVHVLAGVAQGEVARRQYLDNLRWAAGEAPERVLTIEPLNAHDMPGYFLHDFDQARTLLTAVGADNLGLQFDLWHAHRNGLSAVAACAETADITRHVQIAGLHARHEPDDGAIDLPDFLRGLERRGYAGWVSAEYHPLGATSDGLGWLGACRSFSER
ncbi:MAG: TIM barrel protein [Paracoccaceae bacterium]